MGDPVRLRERRSGASQELRELLVAGRAELPEAERLRAVAGRLGLPAAAAPSGAELLAKTSGAGLGVGGVAKIGVLVLVLVLGAGAGALSMRHRMPAAVASEAMPGVPAKVDALASASRSVDRPAASATPVAAETPSASVRARARVPHTKALAMPGTTRSAHAEASAIVDVPAAEVNRPIQPVHVAAPATWGSSTPIVAQAPIDAGVSSSAPATGDVGSLEVARRVLATDPSRALRLALRDEETTGGLVEDRDVIIIQALVRLGRLAEARARAARFLRVFPASSHRSEIAAPFGFDPGRQNP